MRHASFRRGIVAGAALLLIVPFTVQLGCSKRSEQKSAAGEIAHKARAKLVFYAIPG